MWYVYILQGTGNRFWYVGSTNDLERRMIEHRDGQCHSTKAHRPLELVSYIAVQSEYQARSLEKYFKTGSGKAILKVRILNNEDLAKSAMLSEA